ncbi:hypothetical protein BSKO_09471 [Bryopsis sp. KO-2023]|nr:hypothetical protein BSKO_09471 [Bryopsis sp. KO-2023]
MLMTWPGRRISSTSPSDCWKRTRRSWKRKKRSGKRRKRSSKRRSWPRFVDPVLSTVSGSAWEWIGTGICADTATWEWSSERQAFSGGGTQALVAPECVFCTWWLGDQEDFELRKAETQ